MRHELRILGRLLERRKKVGTVYVDDKSDKEPSRTRSSKQKEPVRHELRMSMSSSSRRDACDSPSEMGEARSDKKSLLGRDQARPGGLEPPTS